MIEVHAWTDGSQLGLIRHYREEFLLVNLSILVKVKFINHRLSVTRDIRKLEGWGSETLKDVQFVILQSITNFLGHPSEVAQTNLPCVIIVEQLECPTDLFHGIPRQYPFAHYNK